ncbi:MAG: hypothetical protein AB1679_24860 [Actinomycetota bacterium]
MNRRRSRHLPTSEILPRPAPDVVEDGIPATEEVPDELLLTHDVSLGPVPPADEPVAADDWGTTVREERSGEPLDIRLTRENPDRPDSVDEPVRPVFQPGAEYWVDEEAAEIGDLDASWEDTPSPEELALRIDSDPPGLTYDEGPDYLDDGEP